MLLNIDELRLCKRHIDASFAVFKDLFSRSGGVLMMSESGVRIISGSSKKFLLGSQLESERKAISNLSASIHPRVLMVG